MVTSTNGVILSNAKDLLLPLTLLQLMSKPQILRFAQNDDYPGLSTTSKLSPSATQNVFPDLVEYRGGEPCHYCSNDLETEKIEVSKHFTALTHC